ncbi:hypothetical protein CFAM422_001703 [Trichoderma lentiforme]|uniref:Uncharacterized protein n=1 Tax=Trichoderma lentiforme TaxID=1567552 RepID=A0A9P4XMI0_9HYPO|nr:hypothetical protein CFAM422_001703 [Trichoderma lentiforme]
MCSTASFIERSIRWLTQKGHRSGLSDHGLLLLKPSSSLSSLTLFSHGSGLLLGSLLFLLELSKGVLKHHFGVVLGIERLLVGLRLGESGLDGGQRRERSGMSIGQAADDLVTDQGAGVEARLDTHDAQDLLADGGRTRVAGNGHEARHAVGQVVNVVGRVDAAVAVAALATYQQAVALLEAVNPSRRELGRALLLVARQLAEDALRLLAQLLVGGLAARGLDLLVPQQHQLLDGGALLRASGLFWRPDAAHVTACRPFKTPNIAHWLHDACRTAGMRNA